MYNNYDAHTHTAKHIHTYTNNHTQTDVCFDYLRSSSDRLQIQIYTLIEKQIQILHLWIATIQLSYTAIALFASFHILATLLSLSAYIDMYSIVVYRYIYSTRSKKRLNPLVSATRLRVPAADSLKQELTAGPSAGLH